MTTLLDTVLPIIRSGWELVESLGVTKFSVVVKRTTWSEGEGMGEPSYGLIAIKPNPERKLNPDGSITLAPIVPPTPGCGYTIDDLIPADGSATEYLYEVTGDSGTLSYCFGRLDTSDAFEWKLHLVPLSTAGPEG